MKYLTFSILPLICAASGTVTQAVIHYSLPDDRMTILPKIKRAVENSGSEN